MLRIRAICLLSIFLVCGCTPKPQPWTVSKEWQKADLNIYSPAIDIRVHFVQKEGDQVRFTIIQNSIKSEYVTPTEIGEVLFNHDAIEVPYGWESNYANVE